MIQQSLFSAPEPAKPKTKIQPIRTIVMTKCGKCGKDFPFNLFVDCCWCGIPADHDEAVEMRRWREEHADEISS